MDRNADRRCRSAICASGNGNGKVDHHMHLELADQEPQQRAHGNQNPFILLECRAQ